MPRDCTSVTVPASVPVHPLIQVLPKHALEAVLCGLCGPALQDAGGACRSSNPESSEGGNSCAWTELTMPVITAALNLKPPLSDNAIAVLVRKVEAASEQLELQVSQRYGWVLRYP